MWVQDAYTTTDRYPYAQDYNNPGRLPADSGLNTSFNYVRNSVKAAVDAYDGTVTLLHHRSDRPDHPGLRVGVPEAVQADVGHAGQSLPAHLRYPEDLFRVQTDMWGRYHMTDPQAFYQAGDAWNPAQDPGVGAQATTPTTQAPVRAPQRPGGLPDRGQGAGSRSTC